MKPAIFLSLLIIACACNNSDESSQAKEANNDIDAARNFLEAALKGNYQQASSYMLQDSTNIGYLDVTERKYTELPAEEKRNLREASIWFYDPLLQNDSTSIIVFANSYKKDKDTLKIIKQDSKWLVDLKYLFMHDMDTTVKFPPLPKKDSTAR